jgi:hypothetical protein
MKLAGIAEELRAQAMGRLFRGVSVQEPAEASAAESSLIRRAYTVRS